MQCEEDWVVMHALHQGHGWSIARIAREFDVSWRTARRYASAETVPRYRPRARPAELSRAQAAHVTRRLGVHPELRATTLYREVQELGYVGSYPSFARRDRLLRPADRQADSQVRFETDPGVQVQADWADCGQWLVGEQLCTLHALVAVLGFSRMVAVRFATETTRPTTLAAAARVPGRPWRGTWRGPHRPGSGAGDRFHPVGPAGVRSRVDRPGRGARHPPSSLPAVPGQDQGQGRTGDPRTQGGPPGLGHGPADAAVADAGRLLPPGGAVVHPGSGGPPPPHYRPGRPRGLVAGASAARSDPRSGAYKPPRWGCPGPRPADRPGCPPQRRGCGGGPVACRLPGGGG